VRSAAVVLPKEVAFQEGAKDALIARHGTPVTSV
jgi:virulence-associated protein VagC